MTFRFVARAAGAEIDPDGDFVEAGVSEREDGSGFALLFMCDGGEPDDQDIPLGLDTHCLVTAGQGTAYGCVREVVLTGNVLRVSLDPSALAALRLEDPDIEVILEAPAADTARFREVLPQVLAYGREEARPVCVAL
ncbi:Imm10 family immunity protein [Streptomyces sp. NPDC047085]|uniref:Imm10 family immunity protein n=1 Tax=Streptomyces sp. NPDC047085 TaxID=3155140 RepID=UPI0033DD21DA